MAFSLEEAASRGTIAAVVLIISSLSSENPNASLMFGGFFLVLAQNILLPGSQIIFSNGLLKIFFIQNTLIRVITEIRIERRRRKLGLPRAKFKKRKIRILSRDISLPVLYQKEVNIKQLVMIKLIKLA